jgi:hypothetical protein
MRRWICYLGMVILAFLPCFVAVGAMAWFGLPW